MAGATEMKEKQTRMPLPSCAVTSSNTTPRPASVGRGICLSNCDTPCMRHPRYMSGRVIDCPLELKTDAKRE